MMGAVRVFLALSVMATHNNFILGGFLSGFFAVKLFFAISGFCMALVLNQKYTEANPIRFYVARYLRLWPTYLVILLLVAIFIHPLHVIPGAGPLTNFYFFASTISLFGSETLWWVAPSSDGLIPVVKNTDPTLAMATGLPQMWSVGIELAFYLGSPLFARNWRTVAGLFVAAFAVHAAFVLLVPNAAFSPFNRSAVTFFWIYLAGMLAYWLWVATKERLHRVRIPALLLSVVGIAMAGGFAILRGYQPYQHTFGVFTEDALILLFAAYLVPLFHFTGRIKADRAIGELSYAIYVVHFPITSFLITAHRGSAMWTLVMAGLSLTAAAILNLAVERPMDKWRSRVHGAPPSWLLID